MWTGCARGWRSRHRCHPCRAFASRRRPPRIRCAGAGRALHRPAPRRRPCSPPSAILGRGHPGAARRLPRRGSASRTVIEQRHKDARELRVLPAPAFTVLQGSVRYAAGMRAETPLLNRTLAIARVDWTPSHRQPNAVRLAIATVIAVAGSLIADAIVVAIGTRFFPGQPDTSTSGSATTPSSPSSVSCSAPRAGP